MVLFCFFKQKTAYEMRISDWSSDVCSSDLMRIAVMGAGGVGGFYGAKLAEAGHDVVLIARGRHLEAIREHGLSIENLSDGRVSRSAVAVTDDPASIGRARSEERRVGQECVSPCRSRWAPSHYKKQPQ